MQEEWRDIQGYEGLYQVSNLGRVRSVNKKGSDGRKIKGKILKGGSFSNDYLFVCLRKKSSNKNHLIHRLVASHFLTNPNNYNVVNHIDGIKTNNIFTNLEWCTQSENLKHGVETGLIENQCKICRKVTINKNGESKEFESMKSCAEYFGFKKGWLQNKIRKYGLSFEYLGYTITVSERSSNR